MTALLRAEGHPINRKRVQRLMRRMGIAALGPKPRTTKPAPGHKIFPYLLRNLVIERPNHVWAADITSVPIGRGFLYLVAIIDWASRAVLAWRLSNTMDVRFCLAALEEALARFGKPEIFNTDQGSQFTSGDFTGMLATAGIRISMDGRGRWIDNVFVERLTSKATPTAGRPKPRSRNGWPFTITGVRTRRWRTGHRWRCGATASQPRPVQRLWI
jgi:putative transposase